jgi:sec-independent protein translocase protein TatA
MFGGLFQPMHLLIILVIALVVVGPGKLPELGKTLGKTIQGFKKAMSDVTDNINATSEVKETPKGITSLTAMEMKQETASKDTVEAKKETAV